MLDTSTRLLRLLSLLQARPSWSGAVLAEELEITPRTLRRDMDRLRSLGYTIIAATGPGGGYHLSRGRSLPPLLLNDEEAVAITVALRSAVDAYEGLGETAVNVLVKLEQLLPARLRRQAGALQAVTVSIDGWMPSLQPDRLVAIAAACRDHRQLTLRYRDRLNQETERQVEPLRLAHTGNRLWYLLAWDLGRDDWRTFRVDRILASPVPGPPFIPRPPPADIAGFVTEAVALMPGRYHARFRLVGTMGSLMPRIPAWVGRLEPLDAGHCVLTLRADTWEDLAARALLAGAEMTLLEPEELRPHLHGMAERLRRAAT